MGISFKSVSNSVHSIGITWDKNSTSFYVILYLLQFHLTSLECPPSLLCWKKKAKQTEINFYDACVSVITHPRHPSKCLGAAAESAIPPEPVRTSSLVTQCHLLGTLRCELKLQKIKTSEGFFCLVLFGFGVLTHLSVKKYSLKSNGGLILNWNINRCK